MKKANIVSLYKHNIVHKNTKNLQLKQLIISFVICIISVFSFVYLGIVNKEISTSIKTFNPISELYRDVETASFVSAENLSFIVPIKTEKSIVNSDNIQFEVTSSIMVYATCDGVVCDIGIDNYKYIKIKHTNELISVITNIDVVGVKVGDVVKQGKEIATVKPNKVCNFYIENNGERVNGLYLNKSFVKWK